MAERVGFEPTNPCRLHTFQACALNQTTRPLQLYSGAYYTVFLVAGHDLSLTFWLLGSIDNIDMYVAYPYFLPQYMP